MNPSYPSTFDCEPMLRVGDDGVLLCMRNTRDRLAERERHVIGHYAMGSYGNCAVGTVFSVDGLSQHAITESVNVHQLVEKELSDEARDAIRRFDEAAVELCPTSAREGWSPEENWTGPFEYVNERWYPEEHENRDEWRFEVGYNEVKETVREMLLEICDHAIAVREVELREAEAVLAEGQGLKAERQAEFNESISEMAQRERELEEAEILAGMDTPDPIDALLVH